MTMNEERKRRLESQGWQFGDAAGFLGLSEQEAAYVELKLVLSQKLKQQRKTSRMTQAELARLIRSSQSRVAKMEAGDPSVSADLLIRSLLAMGVSRKELGRAIS
jgi:DNA-binding XRE family transcriptional regulator